MCFDDPQGMYVRWVLPPAHLICTRLIYALGEFLGRDVDRQCSIVHASTPVQIQLFPVPAGVEGWGAEGWASRHILAREAASHTIGSSLPASLPVTRHQPGA